jgi:hypothetical protein
VRLVVLAFVLHLDNVHSPFILLGIVWSETKQMNLIDSIFHNFYVPPIVFGTVLVSIPASRNLTFCLFLKLLNAVQTGVNVEYASMENNG